MQIANSKSQIANAEPARQPPNAPEARRLEFAICHSPIASSSSRRGGIYFAVIGVSMLVGLIGLGAMAAVRAQRLTAVVATDTIAARELSRSAVELGALLVTQESAWRSARTSGPWITGRPLGGGTVDIHGIDPLDANLANRPTDKLTIRGVGKKGAAQQIIEVTLAAHGPPMDALQMALHTGGELRIRPGARINAPGATVSTNGDLRNEGVIDGSVECRSVSSIGTITGSFNPAAPVKPMPGAAVVSMYQALGATMSAPSTISNVLISPESNPWGGTNPDGVYVISTSTNLIIRDMRLYGTLVILAPGCTVTIESLALMQPARTDYPVLVVQGDLILHLDSAQTMNESTIGRNLNPSHAPYEGADNLSTTDTYPVEIRGLVHTTGRVSFTANTRIRGSLICESTGSNSVEILASPEIVYDTRFLTAPIMGYMKSVTMTVEPGTWKQVVLP